jgi:16S rRNA (guanine966-N2)-methyltransferase
MRIIAGKLKGRKLNPPAKIPARPTTDYAREGLFNILQNTIDFTDVAFLDLFSGTGSISFEMGSRGCTNITAVEKDPRSVTYIKQQAAAFNLSMQVCPMDVFDYIRTTSGKFDLIIADPPYALPQLSAIPDAVFQAGILNSGGWLVLEHNQSNQFDDHPHFLKKRNYGSTIFSIFEQP